jgi:hypothetical protein
MSFDAILNEVEQLHGVGARLEGLAEHHTPVTEQLLTIAGSVRSTATLLAVLVATKLHTRDGHQRLAPEPD